MSEFTDGLLLLKEHAPLAQAALADLTHPYIFKDLNERWSAIFLEKPDDPAYSWIVRHSADFPMLYFGHAEDDGWSYILFHSGKEKASVEVMYALEYRPWHQIAELLYPSLDPHVDLDPEVSGQIDDLVRKSDRYQQDVKEQYICANVEEFAIFGLSTEEIKQLQQHISIEGYEKHTIDDLSQVDVFKKVLGIEEMSWMSYRYIIHRREEGYED